MTESYRMYASISFVAVLIIVGVPLWWKTTEVYRVSLPYTRIYNLDSIEIKIHSNIRIASSNTDNVFQIKNELLNNLSTSDIYDLSIEIMNLPKTFDGSLEEIRRFENDFRDIVLIEWPNLRTDIFVTSSRTILFKPTTSYDKLIKTVRDWILTENSLKATMLAISSPTTARHDAAGQRRIPPSATYDINLSVALPNPDKIKVDWAPKEIIEKYLQPFLSEINFIHNFTLKSQWLYFVQLDINPDEIEDNTVFKRHYSLPEEILPHLITPLEKKLASHTSNNPCLNFVLYVPPCESAPIHIYTKTGKRITGLLDAFLSPRWGGVVIGNPDIKTCEGYLNGSQHEIPIYQPSSKEIMGYFLSQLRLLLGIQNQESIEDVEIESVVNVMPRKWEVDALTRMRIIEQVTSAKLILRSLAQLLGEISNIVINDAVGASIYNAVQNIEYTSEYLKKGQLSLALHSSRKAFLSAEAAFTDPSLLALLYFPDDQKYAVYIPLFLPVMIPVIISFKNIWLWLKNDSHNKEKID